MIARNDEAEGQINYHLLEFLVEFSLILALVLLMLFLSLKVNEQQRLAKFLKNLAVRRVHGTLNFEIFCLTGSRTMNFTIYSTLLLLLVATFLFGKSCIKSLIISHTMLSLCDSLLQKCG